jgi:hypothetical protein
MIFLVDRGFLREQFIGLVMDTWKKIIQNLTSDRPIIHKLRRSLRKQFNERNAQMPEE